MTAVAIKENRRVSIAFIPESSEVVLELHTFNVATGNYHLIQILRLDCQEWAELSRIEVEVDLLPGNSEAPTSIQIPVETWNPFLNENACAAYPSTQ